jgi:hypothetical protein
MLRELTMEEVGFVSGGEIVVVGPRPTPVANHGMDPYEFLQLRAAFNNQAMLDGLMNLASSQVQFDADGGGEDGSEDEEIVVTASTNGVYILVQGSFRGVQGAFAYDFARDDYYFIPGLGRVDKRDSQTA